MTSYLWGLLLVPATVFLAVDQLADANFLGWQDSSRCKALMEIVHPSLLGAGALIAIAGWLTTRVASMAFLGVMCMFFLFRELAGQGTSFIVYIGLIGLIIFGHQNKTNLATLLNSRLACSCMATGLISYAFSQLMDRGVVNRLGRLVIGDWSWRLPYSSQIEESLEALGGAFMLTTVLVVLALSVAGTRRVPSA